MNEIWKAYNDKYEVSNYGRVRHVRHRRILKYCYPNNGSPQVNLGNHSINVSRLVAASFLGERPAGYDIHHKDHNPSNNHIDNLEYEPRSEHKTKHHRKHPVKDCPVCGTKLKKHNAQTCSWGCHHILKSEERFCVTCGRAFRVGLRALRRAQKDPRYIKGGCYCSRACFHEARKGVPLYKNTKIYKQTNYEVTA